MLKKRKLYNDYNEVLEQNHMMDTNKYLLNFTTVQQIDSLDPRFLGLTLSSDYCVCVFL